jgi:DNA-binding MarR family transcriptional regulator
MTTNTLNRVSLSKVAAALEEFRKLDAQMPPQMMQTFLWVCVHDGITMKDLADRVGISQSSMSRNVAALSKQHRLGKPGYDLIAATEDPAERRRKIVTLTPKGKRVAASLSAIFD